MKRSNVRCRCGHQVLAKEVLRTDLYERPSGREYVYVKYRCKHCKRVGETFVAENRWDWRIFEAPQNEMSEAEREVFADQAPISSEDLLDFHRLLQNLSWPTELDLHHAKILQNVNLGDAESTEITSENLPTDKLESKLESKADTPSKLPRSEPKRGDIKSSNDALNSNPDVDSKKDVKKDAGKTGGNEDGLAR